MATDEPKRTAADLLKAYSQKRRDEAGVPPELHPATRKLLQDEVARTFPKPKPAPPPRSNPFAGWWLRLAWGAVALAAVVVAALMLSPPGRKASEPFQLAQATKSQVVGPSGRAKVSTEPDNEPRALVPEMEASAAQTSVLADDAKAKKTLPEVKMSLPVARGRVETLSIRRGGDTAAPALAERQETIPTQQLAPVQMGEALGGAAAVATNLSADRRIFGFDAVDKLTTQPLARGTVDAETDKRLVRTQDGAPGGPPPVSALAPATANANSPAGVEPPVSFTTQNRLAANKDSNRRLQLAVANDRPVSATTAATLTLTASQRDLSLAARQDTYAFFNSATGAQSLRFVQLDTRARYRRNFNSPPPPPILMSFQVDRAQDQIRIVDADGSIYEGQVSSLQAGDGVRSSFGAAREQLGTELRKDPASVENAPAAAGQTIRPSANEGLNFSFRATGTNVMLHQSVVFSGAFAVAGSSTDSNGVAAAKGGLMDRGRLVEAAPTPTTAVAQSRTRLSNAASAVTQSVAGSNASKPLVGVIQGKVVVGGTNAFNLEAVQAPR